MTDKQKEAIEFFKNDIEKRKQGKNYFVDYEKVMIYEETALNLIQTQQAEIEHQKEKRENQKKELSILNEKQKEFNKLRNTVNSYKGQFKRQQAEIDLLKDFKEIAESKVTDLNPIGLARTNQLLSRQCHKLQEESEKKDKIIDEMATYIVTLDIEEDICEKTKNEHCDKMNFGECEDCIKQYFERKVEG